MDPELVAHYQVLSRLGSGGMGVVFKARDTKLNRTVALKVLSPALTGDPQARTRLIREARAASTLDHHNIATVFEVCGTEDGGAALAMAYYEGQTLAALIETGPLPVEDAVNYVAQVADGLSEAHQAGIIHCDIKPANLLVTSRGVVKILDFGIARISRQTLATTTGSSIAGTLPYMSPEQVNGRELDPRTDLWSLGVVLYQLLTGRLPFHGEAGVTISAILNHEPEPVHTFRNVPAHVDTVVKRALSKSIDARIGDAREFAALLRTPAASAPAPLKRVTRLIVLPFRLLRADPDIDFLSFSLSDAITASLIGLQTLQVCSSAMAARVQPGEIDVSAIKRQTGADLVLRGTLVRAGSKVRVQAELMESSAGTALWSETNDVVFGDLFALQDDLTRRIVEGLTVPLTAHDQRQLGRDVPADPMAFEAFLRANQLAQHMARWSDARLLYEQCLRRDPSYAPAWARLGRVCWLMAKYIEHESQENLARAKAAFVSALSVNPELALAHHLFTPLQVDVGQACDAMVRLLSLARGRGNDAELFAGLVHACRYCGLLEASIAADGRARAIDPRIQTSVMQTRFHRGEYEHVAVQDITAFPVIVGSALIAVGRSQEAADRLHQATWSDHRLHEFATAVGAIASGNHELADQTIAAMLASGFRAPEELFHISRLLARRGSIEWAIDVLGRAIDGGFYSLRSLEQDGWLAPLHGPRVQEVLRRARSSHAAAVEAYKDNGGLELLGPAR